MTTDRIAALEALLAETEAAHGVYETTELNGVYDPTGRAGMPDTPSTTASARSWGARSPPTSSRGTSTTCGTSSSSADPRPTDPWGTYLARRLVEDA